MSFDLLASRVVSKGMSTLGTAVVLRHTDGRQDSISAIIDDDVQYVGEYNQVPEKRTVAQLRVDDGRSVRPGSEIEVTTGPYRGRYSLEKLTEGDAFVERFALRPVT